jgi:methyl-accepting chemotaxis protein
VTVLDELIVAMGKTRDDVESLESSAGTVLEMLGDRADLAAQIGAESMAARLRNGQEAAERTYSALTQTGDVTDEMLSAVQDVSLRTLSTEVLDALKRACGLLDRIETDIGTVTQCVQEAHDLSRATFKIVSDGGAVAWAFVVV